MAEPSDPRPSQTEPSDPSSPSDEGPLVGAGVRERAHKLQDKFGTLDPKKVKGYREAQDKKAAAAAEGKAWTAALGSKPKPQPKPQPQKQPPAPKPAPVHPGPPPGFRGRGRGGASRGFRPARGARGGRPRGRGRGAYAFERRAAPDPGQWREAAQRREEREREQQQQQQQKRQQDQQQRQAQHTGEIITHPLPTVQVPELRCTVRGKNTLKVEWSDVTPPRPASLRPPTPPPPEKKKKKKEKDTEGGDDDSKQEELEDGEIPPSDEDEENEEEEEEEEEPQAPPPPPEWIPDYSTTYTLEMATDAADPVEFERVYEGRGRSYTAKNLSSGCAYTFRVRATVTVPDPPADLASNPASTHSTSHQTVRTPVSRSCTFLTKPTVPAQPEPPQMVAAGPTSLTVKWEAPHTVGAPVQEYTLESDASPGQALGSLMVVYHGPQTEFTCEELKPDTDYRFKVRAINRVGGSQYSAVVSYRTDSSTPPAVAQPTGPSGRQRKPTSVHVKWTQPPTHGEPIKGYVVEMAESSDAHEEGKEDEEKTKTKKKSAFKTVYRGTRLYTDVHGLDPDTEYAFRVQALNACGAGPFSPVMRSRTAASVPSRPEAPFMASHTETELVVGWRAPAANGQPVYAYQLEMEGKRLYEGPNTSYRLTELAPATFRSFTVTALNKVGKSPKSLPAELGTKTSVPDAPASVTVSKVTSSSFDVHWKTGSDNGAPIHSARVCVSDRVLTHEFRGDHASLHVTGLAPVQTYRVTVACVNHGGEGPAGPQPPLTVQTTIAPPLAPKPPTLRERTRTSLLVEWGEDVPSHEPDGSRVEWALEMKALGNEAAEYRQLVQGAARFFRADGLATGRTYSFRLQRRNSAGDSPWSIPFSVATEADPPAAPSELSLDEATGRSLALSWASAESLASPIIRYTLELKPVGTPDSQFKRGYSGPATTRTVKGLQPHTRYDVRIAALNEAGQGPWALGKFATIGDVPPAPRPPRVTELWPGDGKPPSSKDPLPPIPDLDISWTLKKGTAPKRKDEAIHTYVLEACVKRRAGAGGPAHDDDRKFETWYEGSEASFRLPAARLEHDLVVRLRVTAVNKYGRGHTSNEFVYQSPRDRREQLLSPSARRGGTSRNKNKHDPYAAAPDLSVLTRKRTNWLYVLGAPAAALVLFYFVYRIWTDPVVEPPLDLDDYDL